MLVASLDRGALILALDAAIEALLRESAGAPPDLVARVQPALRRLLADDARSR